jgi:lysophospholipase L1-like esterase
MVDPALLIAQQHLNSLPQFKPTAIAQSSVGSSYTIRPQRNPWRAQPEAMPSPAEFSRGEISPRSGSQLYMQRLAALKSGRLYTRLPISSYHEVWQTATQKPTYEQWRKLLALEARAVARGQGDRRLSIFLGDSLSMWFPYHSLPQNQLWLNQGISGDTTRNILLRVRDIVRTRPDQVYLMAGVNDLKSGATDNQIVWNLQSIIRRLRQSHPNVRIVMQSILPTRSHQIPHDRIAGINRRLAVLAQREGVNYLDLYSEFVDRDGQMLSDYTTDGIHLTAQGYATWQSTLRQADLSIAQR